MQNSPAGLPAWSLSFSLPLPQVSTIMQAGHCGSALTQLLPPDHALRALLQAPCVSAWPLWLFFIWTLVCFDVCPGCSLSAVILASLNTEWKSLSGQCGVFFWLCFLGFLLTFSFLSLSFFPTPSVLVTLSKLIMR